MNKDAVLILGASSGIGQEVIREIANEQTIFLAHYHESDEGLKKIQSELNTQIIPLKADFSKEADIVNLIEAINTKYPLPNKIVHLSAPAVTPIRFKDITWQDFQRNLDIQLKSAVLILKEFLPIMAKNKSGKVVFVLTSYTVGLPPKALSHYVTVKYALLGLMKSLASEYAGKNININAISPSMIQTDFLKNIPEKLIEIEAEMHPLKRIAYPKDIAPMVKFLLSQESNFITGTNIPLTGGSVF